MLPSIGAKTRYIKLSTRYIRRIYLKNNLGMTWKNKTSSNPVGALTAKLILRNNDDSLNTETKTRYHNLIDYSPN